MVVVSDAGKTDEAAPARIVDPPRRAQLNVSAIIYRALELALAAAVSASWNMEHHCGRHDDACG